MFVVAFFSFIAYHATAIREARSIRGIVSSPTFVLTLFTAAYSVVVILNFDGAAHAGPLLPFIAFWAATYAPATLAKATTALNRALPRRRVWPTVAKCAPLAIVLLLLFADTPVFSPRFTLRDQRALLRRVTEDGALAFLALNAPEFYVLTDAPSPVPYIRFYPRMDRLAEARGLDAFVATVADELQPVVILPQPRRIKSALRRLLAERILDGVPSTVSQQPITHPGVRELLSGVPAVRSYVIYRLSPDDISAKRDAAHCVRAESSR